MSTPIDFVAKPAPTEHKSLDPILDCVMFNALQQGPFIQPLSLFSALTSSVNYPRSRITLAASIGTVSLTVHQAEELRAQLDIAIADVLASCPSMATPDGDDLPEAMPRG